MDTYIFPENAGQNRKKIGRRFLVYIELTFPPNAKKNRYILYDCF